MRIAFLFPGQGSQKVGMGADLVERHPHLKERYFDVAADVLGFDLLGLCTDGPEEALRSTDNTQPAIFTVSMALLDLLREQGVEPAAAAGHSLGEYGALVCAGVLDFVDALKLVRRRGELMAAVNAATPGAMAAVIGLAPEEVDAICAAAAAEGGVVEPANYNEPRQTVISGEVGPVERASAAASEAGARVIPLAVGAPFHCSLMDALAEEFAAELDRYAFRDPTIPVIANVTAEPVGTGAEVVAALRGQVAGAVRWTDTLRRLDADGFDTFVEVGPGRVLSGLVAKTLGGAETHATENLRRLDKALESLTG